MGQKDGGSEREDAGWTCRRLATPKFQEQSDEEDGTITRLLAAAAG